MGIFSEMLSWNTVRDSKTVTPIIYQFPISIDNCLTSDKTCTLSLIKPEKEDITWNVKYRNARIRLNLIPWKRLKH